MRRRIRALQSRKRTVSKQANGGSTMELKKVCGSLLTELAHAETVILKEAEQIADECCRSCRSSAN